MCTVRTGDSATNSRVRVFVRTLADFWIVLGFSVYKCRLFLLWYAFWVRIGTFPCLWATESGFREPSGWSYAISDLEFRGIQEFSFFRRLRFSGFFRFCDTGRILCLQQLWSGYLGTPVRNPGCNFQLKSAGIHRGEGK